MGTGKGDLVEQAGGMGTTRTHSCCFDSLRLLCIPLLSPFKIKHAFILLWILPVTTLLFV